MIGCFVGVIILGIAKQATSKASKTSGLLSKEIEKAKENSNHLTTGTYVFGVLCIFLTAWTYSTVGVITSYAKDIHFSVMMFFYATIATLIMGLYILIEDQFKRLMSYNQN